MLLQSFFFSLVSFEMNFLNYKQKFIIFLIINWCSFKVTAFRCAACNTSTCKRAEGVLIDPDMVECHVHCGHAWYGNVPKIT